MNQLMDIQEEELVKRICNGETDLFEVIVRKYNPILYRTGRSYGFNHEDVEDLMQDSFIAAYRSLAKFERRAAFKTWLVRIMLNECYHKRNKLSKQKVIPMDKETSVDQLAQPPAATENLVLNRELNRLIAAAMMEVPLNWRMVFSLREISGLSTAETAAALEISEANVKVRLGRAKQQLRKSIEKLYSPEEIFEFHLSYCDKMVDRVMQTIKE